MASPLETFLALVGGRPAAAIPVPANPLAAAPVYRDPRIPGDRVATPLPQGGRTLLDDVMPFIAGVGTPSGTAPGTYQDPRIPRGALPLDLEGQRGLAMSGMPTPAAAPSPDPSLIGGMHDTGAPGLSALPDLSLIGGLHDNGGIAPDLATPAAAPSTGTASLPLTAPAAAPSPVVAAPAAPTLDIPTATGATPAATPFADTMKSVQAGFGPAPKYDTPDAGMDPWMALLKGGLATMAAGSRPGATLGGSLATGALTGINEFDRRRAERNAALRAERQDQIKTAGTAAQIAGAQTQADQGTQRLSLEERRIVTDAKLKQAGLDFEAKKLGAQLENSALDRDNRVAVAQLNRDSAERVADAQRGSTEALHMLSVQANRDAALTKQIDDTIAKGKTGAGGIKETYTPEEEAQIRQRIILDSPGTTLNEQFRTEQAASKFRQIEDAVKTPEGLAAINQKRAAEGKPAITSDEILKRANAAFKDEMEAIKRDRIGLRSGGQPGTGSAPFS